MQNMFKTVQMGQQQSKTMEEQNIYSSQVPDSNDFSTMQNLFAIQKLSMPQMEGLKNIETLNEIGNVNEININDFNTMQNLFKTNAHM